MKLFFLQTFGCKLNQADTAAIRAALRARGLCEASGPEEADLVVVNTCTVTSRADQHARRAIRKLKRFSPHSRLIVTGCYAQRAARQLVEMPEVDEVLGLDRRQELYQAAGGDAPQCVEFRSFEEEADYGGRTRAFLKVQEGCDLNCSYCVVQTVRGRSRSLPVGEVVKRLRALREEGFREVVLTGTHLGLWGKDSGRGELTGLLRAIDAASGMPGIRLCSLEPYEVTDELLELMAGSEKIAPHLHLAVQSGSAKILRAMRRPPDPGQIRDAVQMARELMPECGIGADVIVGFPGESDDDFAATAELLAGAPFTYSHVFPFSPRPGTDAASMSGRVHPETVTHRSAELRVMMAEKNFIFRKSMIGRALPALLLSRRGGQGRMTALTGNYIHVAIEDTPEGAANTLRSVIITGAGRRGTTGRLASSRASAPASS